MDSFYVLGVEDRRRFAKIAAAAWTDDAFARRYAAQPYAVLAEYGVDYPTDVAPPALPRRPDGDLNIETLEAIAAGAESSVSSVSCVMTATQACPD